jgi:hypothetical protein
VPGVGVEPKSANGDSIAPVSVEPKQENPHPLPSPLKSVHQSPSAKTAPAEACRAEAPQERRRGEDVARVVLAWAKLPESIRQAILTLVEVGKIS